MAKAYLGKISALVTANTSDFNSKLNASAKEVRSFAASMQSSLSRAQSNATASLRGIYTEAQKLERALKAASSLRLSFKGFDTSQFKNIEEAADQMRRIASAAELVYKPLQAAAKATETLSSEVRNEFAPALVAAQRQAELLNTALTRGLAVSESSFAAVERRVNSTTAAVSRLREASQSVGGIATGQELRFQQRGFVEQTARASQLQQQALAASGVPSEAVSQIAGRQRQAAEEAQRLLSTLEQIRLTRSGDAAAAETAYNRQVAALRSVNDELEREIALSRRAADAEAERAADAQRRAAAASRLLQVNQSESALVSNQGARSTTDATGRSLQQRLRDIANLRALEEQAAAATLAAAEAQEEAAAATRRRVEAASRLLQINQSESTLLSNEGARSTTDATGRSLQQRLRDIASLRQLEQEAAEATMRAAEAQEEAAAATRRRVEAASRLLPVLQGESELLSNQGARSTTDATGRSIRQRIEDIARLREEESRLGNPTGNFGPDLPPGFGGRSDAGLGASLNDAARQLDRFKSGLASAKSQLDSLPAAVRTHFIPAIQGAEQEFMRLAALGPRATAAEIENAAERMDVLTAAVRRATQAASVQSFGDFINDASVRQSIGELQGLQQILTQIGAVAGGPAARAYEAYRQRLQAAITAGETGLPRVRAELVQLQREAARAAAETGRISFGTAFRRIQRSGDVARGGFDNFSLAVNQAAFAIDDFFSSTGGLEFKLRAVSNNITQLAFILGGTTGLFIGLATVIGGQVALAIAKFAFGLDDAKRRQEAMKAQAEALNATLDKQKNLVESLANAYRDLGRDIKQATLTPREARFEDRQNRNREILGQQADRRREVVAGIVPSVAANRGRLQQLERQAQELPVGRDRARLERQAAALRRQEDAAFGRIDRAAAGRIGQNRGQLEQRRDFLAERLDNLQRDRNRIAQRSGEGDPRIQRLDATIQNVSEQLAEFTLALQRINDEAQATVFQFSGPLQDEIQRAQERLAAAFGDRKVAQQDILNQAGRRLGDIPDRVTRENLSPAGTRTAINEIEAFARPAIQATERLTEFANALNGAEESVRRADEQAKARVDELRAEVSRNPKDRGLQAQLRTAEAGAAELSRRRQQVELGVRRGFNETADGPDANRNRQQQVQREADAANRFADDLKRQGDLIARGFDTARPAAEEFAVKLEKDLQSLEAAAKADPQNARQFLEQRKRGLIEQAAPMLIDMAQARENAILQGPSRAALNASDITTQQGAAELNRLLRGDDPAKDVNLAELKRQSKSLDVIEKAIEEMKKRVVLAN